LPRIFDNIDQQLLPALRETLEIWLARYIKEVDAQEVTIRFTTSRAKKSLLSRRASKKNQLAGSCR